MTAPTQDQIRQLVTRFSSLPREAFLAEAAAFDRAFPDDFQAQNLLGALHAQIGRFDLAEPAFRRALALRPGDLDVRFVLAVSLRELGRPDEAVPGFEAVLAAAPGHNEARLQLGMALLALGEAARAESVLRDAERCDPGEPRAAYLLGLVCEAQERHAEAAAQFERALALQPDHREAQRALALSPGGDPGRRERALRAALWDAPDDAGLNRRLGEVLLDKGDPAGAEAALRRAVAAAPGDAGALAALGLALHRAQRNREAAALFAEAVRLAPDVPVLHNNLGYLLREEQDMAGALAAFERSLALDPAQEAIRAASLMQRMELCDWSALDAFAAVADRLGLGTEPVRPGLLIALETDPRRDAARARAWSGAQWPDPAPPLPALPRAADGRIRVGYLSGDVHAGHATMHLLRGLFREHDRNRFAVSLYSYGPGGEDVLRSQLRGEVDRFVDLAAVDDDAAATLLRSHELDIAVDLKGLTDGSRLGLFARRIAPVQVHWLGYPGTTGTPFIDYFVGDRLTLPDGAESWFSERLIRLPHCYQPNDSLRPIAALRPSRAELGLPEDGFVFACLNNSYKLSRAEWDIWMRLLARVERSVLWLQPSAWAQDRLRTEAAARGVDPARLVYAPWADHAAHLARLACADLVLDTFVCNAHTTASDALWAGVPLLTVPGDTFTARVAASLLHAVGLPELAVDSRAAYAETALALATDPARLAALRARLAANRTSAPLFDSAGHTRAIERAWTAIYERNLAGEPPVSIAID